MMNLAFFKIENYSPMCLYTSIKCNKITFKKKNLEKNIKWRKKKSLSISKKVNYNFNKVLKNG